MTTDENTAKALNDFIRAQTDVNTQTRHLLETQLGTITALSLVLDATIKALDEAGIEVDIPEILRKDRSPKTDG